MNTIGLIGGTSWESTAVYYRLLNEGVRTRVGGLASAKIVLVSVDFAPLASAMANGNWDAVAAALAKAAGQLAAAGADCIGLCTNTMHKVAEAIEGATALPFINILDVTGSALQRHSLSRPLLLATRYTVEHRFYRDHLEGRFGQTVSVPSQVARDQLQSIIFDELCQGRVVPASKAAVLAMVAEARAAGCDSVIFGCTEIGLLLTPADVPLPVLDTTNLHCDALLDVAFASIATTQSQAA